MQLTIKQTHKHTHQVMQVYIYIYIYIYIYVKIYIFIKRKGGHSDWSNQGVTSEKIEK